MLPSINLIFVIARCQAGGAAGSHAGYRSGVSDDLVVVHGRVLVVDGDLLLLVRHEGGAVLKYPEVLMTDPEHHNERPWCCG